MFCPTQERAGLPGGTFYCLHVNSPIPPTMEHHFAKYPPPGKHVLNTGQYGYIYVRNRPQKIFKMAIS